MDSEPPHISILKDWGFTPTSDTQDTWICGDCYIVARNTGNVNRTLVLKLKKKGKDPFNIRFNGRYIFGNPNAAYNILHYCGCLPGRMNAMKNIVIEDIAIASEKILNIDL